MSREVRNGGDLPKYVGPEKSNGAGKLTRGEIKQRFDNETAECYSQRAPAWLPEFEYAFSLIPRLLAPYINEDSEILDLGAGTGNLSRTVLEAFPSVTVDLVDFSEHMLSQSKSVLAEYTGRYTTTCRDMFLFEAEKRYSAVISSFAIHHARGDDEYSKLYKKIYDFLTDTGIFICCDVLAGADDNFSAMNERGWREFLLQQGFPESDVEKILNNYHREDSPNSVDRHFTLLSGAGFDIVDIAWKRHNFGIYLGIKK